MKTNVLCIGAGPEQVPSILAAQKLGLRIITIDIRPDAPGFAVADFGVPVDIADENAVIALAKQYKIAAVLPAPIGRYLTTIGAVNDALQLRGITRQAAVACTDKWEFHQHFAQSGLRHPRCTIAESGAVLPSAIDLIGLPCVLKPRFGSGSRGVIVISDPAQMAAGLRNHAQGTLPTNTTLVEEFVNGNAVGVDGVIQDGRCEIVLLREKQLTPLPYRVEMAYLGPARLTATLAVAIQHAVQTCATGLGLNDCLLHADLVIANDGVPVVIEMSGRPSGLSISSKMVPLVTGVDFLANGIAMLLRQPTEFRPRRVTPVVLKYLPIPPGRVTRAPTLPPQLAINGLLEVTCPLRPGDVLREITSASDSLSRGYVMTQGSDLTAALSTAEIVTTALNIGVEPC